MAYKKNFRKKPKKELQGLQVEVQHGNIEKAMRTLKRKVKDSNLFIELSEREYFTKPSETKRQKHNLAKLRNHYAVQKEKNNDK